MVVDDTRDFTVLLSPPPTPTVPKATITALTYPTTAQAAGASVPISVTVRNDGTGAGVLWGEVVDRDTSSTVGARTNTSSLGVGSSATLTWTLTMPNKNWNLRLNAGHG
jgi:hypothetical protein